MNNYKITLQEAQTFVPDGEFESFKNYVINRTCSISEYYGKDERGIFLIDDVYCRRARDQKWTNPQIYDRIDVSRSSIMVGEVYDFLVSLQDKKPLFDLFKDFTDTMSVEILKLKKRWEAKK